MVKNDIHSQAALAINHTPSSRHMCPEHMVIHHFFIHYPVCTAVHLLDQS